MRTAPTFFALAVCLLLLTSLGWPPTTVAQDFDGLRQTVHELVEQDRIAGAVMFASRFNEPVFRDVYGSRRLDPGELITDDTIFLLASMTKPITAVAMMILYEEGEWRLDDPVAKYIPEFAELKVAGLSGPEAPSHPMTMRELMSHSAGFDVNQAEAYQAVNLRDRTQPLHAMIQKLAALPLAFQPGTDWRYGPSADVQAYLVERLSGQPFEAFLQGRIFTPLRMTDTGFRPVDGVGPGRLAVEKLERISGMFTANADGYVAALPDFNDASARPPYPSGSGGLMSTAHDYERFARMLLNESELDGVRVLSASTVALIRRNVLPAGVWVTGSPGIGFGLGVAVVEDSGADATALPEGAYYWAGGSGTFFWIDPDHDQVFVGMVHAVGSRVPDLRTLAIGAVYPPGQR